MVVTVNNADNFINLYIYLSVNSDYFCTYKKIWDKGNQKNEKLKVFRGIFLHQGFKNYFPLNIGEKGGKRKCCRMR